MNSEKIHDASVRLAYRMRIFACAICIALPLACTLDSAEEKSLTIVSYNVRGTFGDDVAQTQKAAEIALTLRAHHLENSDIILLQEIDSVETVRELVSEHLILHAFRYVAIAPVRKSALTQAIISKYPLQRVRVHTIAHDTVGATRGVLEATADVNGRAVVLYNLHLKSKRGGAEETESQRAAVMSALAERVRVHIDTPMPPDIIIGGDMNTEVTPLREGIRMDVAIPSYRQGIAYADGLHIAQLSHISTLPHDTDSTIFISPWQDANWPGSYNYRDQWEQIDHFFLSQSLFDHQGLEYDDFYIAVDREQIDNVIHATGAQSDHLPIVLIVTVH